jgi:hypothetical protein
MIKMKKLSATTFAMALSLGGLALGGVGCEKGDKDKPKTSPSAGPTDQNKPADPPKPAAGNQGAGGVTPADKPAADTPADPTKPTNTLPADKEPKPASCAGSPKGCAPKPPDPKGAELKVPTGGTGAKVEAKVEAKTPGDDDGCSGGMDCGAPPPKPVTKTGGPENSCSKKSCG